MLIWLVMEWHETGNVLFPLWLFTVCLVKLIVLLNCCLETLKLRPLEFLFFSVNTVLLTSLNLMCVASDFNGQLVCQLEYWTLNVLLILLQKGHVSQKYYLLVQDARYSFVLCYYFSHIGDHYIVLVGVLVGLLDCSFLPHHVFVGSQLEKFVLCSRRSSLPSCAVELRIYFALLLKPIELASLPWRSTWLLFLCCLSSLSMIWTEQFTI